MNAYQVEVKVHGARPPRGKPLIAVTYIIKANNPVDAGVQALNYAKQNKVKHPRTFRDATFTVSPDDIKVF